MAVALDAQASAVTHTASALQTLTNANLTIGTGNAVIALMTFNTTTVSGVGVTWNSVAMTLIGSKVNTANNVVAYAFGLLAPTTGAHSLVANWTTNSLASLDGASWTGVDQTAFATSFIHLLTDATNCSATNYPSSPLTITTKNGDMAFATCGSGSVDNAFSGCNIGTLLNQDQSNENYWSGFHAAVGASTQIQFNTPSTSNTDPCCAVAFDIVAVGNVTAATTGGTLPLMGVG